MSQKVRVGILFGGQSREREISFAGGRTVYDNLDKSIFEAIPIFIDSLGNWIELNWQYIYKGTIRDFYPPVEFLSQDELSIQIYAESLDPDESKISSMIACVGKRLWPHELKSKIDFAFLCLHGCFGEDGQVQGLLDSMQIPYSGSGILPSAIGIDKSFQKKIMNLAGFPTTKFKVLSKTEWTLKSISTLYAEIEKNIGFPCVIRPANQGSSIGVSILDHDALTIDVENAIQKAFFQTVWNKKEWLTFSQDKKIQWLRSLADIREGIGFPLYSDSKKFSNPTQLFYFLNDCESDTLLLEGEYTEQKIIVESFIVGREFSCIVIRNENGKALALPPTEIIKNTEFYDYRSKYLPGLSRKQTPMDLPVDALQLIRKECERLFDLFEFNTYARIDGFYGDDGLIYLNDPNTTSGMLPSSFFFHQAAEIGLNPSQFLSYIVKTSCDERANHLTVPNQAQSLSLRISEELDQRKSSQNKKKRIAVILGGYSFERHISVESGRNIYEKLSSSEKYEAFPVFLYGKQGAYSLFKIPINLMLKDNADDIKEKIGHFSQHPLLSEIRQQAQEIIAKYSTADYQFEPQALSFEQLKEETDAVFIALHGRPGEDGDLQTKLNQYSIPYNGSGPDSSAITIHKYNTLQTLKENGFIVAKQALLSKSEYDKDSLSFIQKIETEFQYPFIAKPVDDGCSSAVVKIKTKEHLKNYLSAIFRTATELDPAIRSSLHLETNEEFPQKQEVLIEELIQANGAERFLEVTGGLITHKLENKIRYQMFEASEALSSGEVLSLEEKFLAGEGQNLTPARYHSNPEIRQKISDDVKKTLQRAAEILGVEGYARIDAFVRVYSDLRSEVIIIEVNSLPGMTPATCIFHQCALENYKPYEFIDQILQYSMQ
ncbi:MAG TPA: D-alanine--D-alanine ligase [Saprospiraceae bacterium]|nr:D-alanine--D-alanine ligase [Saprospiraceae bacterium]